MTAGSTARAARSALDRLTAPARRAEVERRVHFLAAEETRLAAAGFFEGAQSAAKERRYWEFIRALLEAPLAPGPTLGRVH